MFYNLEPFLEELLLFRVCWIRGTLGGGKTLLAVALAERLLRMGMVNGVVTNFPTKLPSALGPEDGLIKRRACIFDEPWTHLDARNSLVNTQVYGAYSRKLEAYWLFPSVYPIDKRLRSVVVWRAARIKPMPFLPTIWLYRWNLDIDYEKDGGGWFLLINPQSYFGMYDTKFIPTSDGGLENRWRRTVFYETEGQTIEQGARLSDYLAGLSMLDDISAIGDMS